MKYMTTDICEVIFKVVFRVTLVGSDGLAKGRIVFPLEGPVANAARKRQCGDINWKYRPNSY